MLPYSYGNYGASFTSKLQQLDTWDKKAAPLAESGAKIANRLQNESITEENEGEILDFLSKFETLNQELADLPQKANDTSGEAYTHFLGVHQPLTKKLQQINNTIMRIWSFRSSVEWHQAKTIHDAKKEELARAAVRESRMQAEDAARRKQAEEQAKAKAENEARHAEEVRLDAASIQPTEACEILKDYAKQISSKDPFDKEFVDQLYGELREDTRQNPQRLNEFIDVICSAFEEGKEELGQYLFNKYIVKHFGTSHTDDDGERHLHFTIGYNTTTPCTRFRFTQAGFHYITVPININWMGIERLQKLLSESPKN